MLETTSNGAADDGAAAGREDQRSVGELGFVAGGRAAVAGVPDPELVERAKRRTFTAKYKLEVLARADACTAPGEIGELLRREGLYTSHLTYWRKQRKDGALKELGRPRGASRPTAATASWPSCAVAPSARRPSLRRPRRSSRSRETSQRSWSRCSVPRAGRGAPSDDLRDRRRAHADHRHQAGVPGAGRRAGDDLPSPPAARAQAAPPAPGAGPGAIGGRARAGARAAALAAVRR